MIDQVITLFVLPELGRRIAEGVLAPEFVKSFPKEGEPGQVLFPALTLILLEEARPVRVMFDREAGCMIHSRVKLPVAIDSEHLWNDLEIAGYSLPNLPANSGYILLLNQNGQCWLDFDFRYNAAFAIEHLRMGETFLELARAALQLDQPRVCFENLFHATEKVSKAILLTIPSGLRGSNDDQPMAFKNHKEVRELYETFGGDVDGRALLAELGRGRNAATYFTGAFEHTVTELEALIVRAGRLCERARMRVPDRERDPPERRWRLPPRGD